MILQKGDGCCNITTQLKKMDDFSAHKAHEHQASRLTQQVLQL